MDCLIYINITDCSHALAATLQTCIIFQQNPELGTGALISLLAVLVFFLLGKLCSMGCHFTEHCYYDHVICHFFFLTQSILQTSLQNTKSISLTVEYLQQTLATWARNSIARHLQTFLTGYFALLIVLSLACQ